MAKGKHWIGCRVMNPSCPCNTCEKDNQDDIELCCEDHCIFCEPNFDCPDYVKDE